MDRVRQVKVFDIAVFDVVLTALLGWYIAKITYIKFGHGYPLNVYRLVIVVLSFVLGIAVHAAFGIDTKLGYYIGFNQDPRPKK
jgi:hypothetical protein